MKGLTALLAIVMISALAGCNKDKEDAPPEDPYQDYETTYGLIQGAIWDRSCTGCHYSGSSFARQSDLVLTADVSYEQLLNRPPNNQAAKEDGLILVGDKGLESLYTSFLWEKINAPDQEHFYSDHPGYGSQMPLGDDPLTNGELEYIRQWILAGAPREGDPVDRDVLKDTSRFQITAFEQLPVPENGLQFHVSPFQIRPNSDRELFIYKSLNNPDPIYISGFEISMREGSHHFILYNFPETFTGALPIEDMIRDVYKDNGDYNFGTLYHMQFHQFVVGTQVPKLRYNFPEGVALEIPANSGFDLNSHYANRRDDIISGEVFANVYTVPKTEVVHTAKILNLNNDDFFLPAGEITTIEEVYTFQNDRHIFQLWSHAHEHNTSFRVYLVGGDRNGEMIYFSNDWEHPPILQLDPPLLLKAGEGLRLEATYDNWEDRDLRFGLSSSDEMMILFGAYYE